MRRIFVLLLVMVFPVHISAQVNSGVLHLLVEEYINDVNTRRAKNELQLLLHDNKTHEKLYESNAVYKIAQAIAKYRYETGDVKNKDIFLFDEDELISSANDTTNFHIVFDSVNEMIGKEVRFAIVNYQKQINLVFLKRGKRLIKYNGIKLPYNADDSYYIEDFISDRDGNGYVQFFNPKNDKRFYLISDGRNDLCSFIYDYSEFNRMKEYTNKHFVYREVEYGEKPVFKPFEYLPYVEVGVSGVSVFEKMFSDGFIVSFYYFTSDGSGRFVDYNTIDLYLDQFISREELFIKNQEYEEQEQKARLVFQENYQKYGSIIAGAIYASSFWNQGRVEKLIDCVGIKNAELILSGEVQIGMTKDECTLSWGEPDKISRTTYSFGTKEQWVYSNKNSYLYFEDYSLTAFTEN